MSRRAGTDAQSFWLNSAGRVVMLSPGEELHLGAMVRAWQDHPGGPDQAPAAVARRGRRARDRFVVANLRLVSHIVRQMRPGLGLQVLDADLPDLLQVGAEGLVRGAEKFDPTRGYKFSTFAYWWIRQGITKWCYCSSRTIRLPLTHAPKLAQLGRVGQTLTATLGRQPTRAELAEALGMRLSDLELVLCVGRPTASLDGAIGADEDGLTLAELLPSPPPEGLSAEGEELREKLAGLDHDQERLTRAHWGVDQAPRSVTALALSEGIPRCQVSRLLEQATRQLRGEALPPPPPLPPPPVVAWGHRPQQQLALAL